MQRNSNVHGKCPKILYTKEFNRMIYTNSADPDQTALPFH